MDAMHNPHDSHNDSSSLIGEPERDPHVADDIRQTGVTDRVRDHNPERDDTNDAHFALAGLSLSAGATAGQGLPPTSERDDDLESEWSTSWEADGRNDTWE